MTLNRLVASWLINALVAEPNIVKIFEITIPGNAEKVIQKV